jgi:hypothetical protein
MFTFPKWIIFFVAFNVLNVFIGVMIYQGASGLTATDARAATDMSLAWQNFLRALVWDYPWFTGYWVILKWLIIPLNMAATILFSIEVGRMVVGFVSGLLGRVR